MERYVVEQHALNRNSEHSSLSIDAQVRIRNDLHAVQVGLDLLRAEMLSGDFRGADLTYATIQHCLRRLSNDEVLSSTSAAARSAHGSVPR